MKFYQVGRLSVGDTKRTSYPYVELAYDNWNDFGFETSYTAHYFSSPNKRLDLGSVKILHISEPRTRYINEMYEFEELEKGNYCSLGTTMEYYRNVKLLGKRVYNKFFDAMKDIAINKKYYESFKGHQGIRDSFFRSSEAKKTFKSAIQYFGGTRKDEVFKFQYNYRPPYSQQKIEMGFDYTDYNFLPHRIYALVGKNGSGKTQFLSQFASALCGGESKENSIEAFDEMPLFSKVIAVSFSAFDDFEKPHQGIGNQDIDEEQARKKNNYIYCGIQGKDGKTLSLKEMTNHARAMLDEILLDEEKYKIWKKTLENVFEDEFKTLIIEDYPERLFDSKLSSGQSILMYTMTSVISNIEYESILLFDEPELHLHPNAISNLIRMMYELLNQFNSYAIVSTHSPLIVQETPSKYIKKMERINNILVVSNLTIEAFGENLSSITEDIFNVRDTESNYMTVFKDAVETNNLKFEEIVREFPMGLSFNSMAFLNLLEKKNNEGSPQ
ncbi:AAA family ATPase [Paenibacillus amylolyticus]|uniref:AAA family ATPase n=1 Tax=Paenibacillus amylolyticus TaxID=1451 RepID=UPI00096EF3EB|nr:AAA family ATPase [Paenibacillus amylolyticus]OMF45409.1 hypothetical protein BK136_09920 [Paenibacillus amylolyticus]